MFKKKYVLWTLTVLLVLNIIIPMEDVFADDHSLEDIEISVYVNDDGSARIKERRDAYLTEGTENFIVIGNLGDSEIVDFEVWERSEEHTSELQSRFDLVC